MTTNTLVYASDNLEVAASEYLFIYRFMQAPRIVPVTLILGDGSPLRSGDRIVLLGGHHTSAGFRRIHLIEGYLEYAGTFQRGDRAARGEDALFRWSCVPDPLIFYGGGVIADPLKLAFSTPGRASRIVETTEVIRA